MFRAWPATGVLGITLALETKEFDIMQRKPRDPAAPILSKVLIWRILLVSAIILAGAFGLFAYELLRGAWIDRAGKMVDEKGYAASILTASCAACRAAGRT